MHIVGAPSISKYTCIARTQESQCKPYKFITNQVKQKNTKHAKKTFVAKIIRNIRKQIRLSLGLSEKCPNELPNTNDWQDFQKCHIKQNAQKNIVCQNHSKCPKQVGLSPGLKHKCSNELLFLIY